MRLIEAFSKMLARIIGLKEAGRLEKAESLVLEAWDTILRLDPQQVKQFSDKEWETFCLERSREELEMIADLLRLEGELRIEEGHTEGVYRLLFKSLELLRAVDRNSDDFSLERFDKITRLEQMLSGADY